MAQMSRHPAEGRDPDLASFSGTVRFAPVLLFMDRVPAFAGMTSWTKKLA
jgi:hypothetical protein